MSLLPSLDVSTRAAPFPLEKASQATPIKGLEAACACLERERGESLRLAGNLEKDVAGLKSDLEKAGIAAEGIREEVRQKERQRAQVSFLS